MSLRIACDLDGTLADMGAALQREAERLFGEGVDVRATSRRVPRRAAGVPSVGPEDQSESRAAARLRPLDDGEERRLWRHVRESDNFWETLQEIEPGAVARLAATAAVQGWEILFITQRPSTAGDTTQVQSQRWLQAHGFELPSVCVVSESRGKVAAALTLDAVIDDRPEYCLDVTSDSSAKPVLVWRHGRGLPPGMSRLRIQVVSSIAEAIEHLTHFQAPAPAPRGVFGRLRHALLPS
jgi:hypothetical protein